MTTVTESKKLRHIISIDDRKANCKITISLDDDCKNGHQDFSITGTFWRIGKPRKDIDMITNGCCHEEILKIRPELKIFVELHLCDFLGVPMYGVENGFYFLVNGFDKTDPNEEKFKTEFCDYYRINPIQFNALRQSENKLRYAINLEKLGILNQWRAQAEKAIQILEELTGQKFLVDSPKVRYIKPTAEEIATEDAKTEKGYYTIENIQKRKEEAEKAGIQKEFDKIKDYRDKVIEKANKEHDVKEAILKNGLEINNFIFYDHSNEGVFNWLDYQKKISLDQFNKFKESVRIEGVIFRIKS